MMPFLSCLLGLLVGGALGGFGIALYRQFRAGRIKIPPAIVMGPLKIDLSSLTPQTQGNIEADDINTVLPLLEIGGSATSGCLSFLGAIMVLVGFLLPWFTCNIAFLMQGSASGFGVLIRLITGVLLSSVIALGGNQEGAALGGALTFLLMLVTAFLVLIPLAGLYIGRTGLRLIQSPKSSNEQRRKISRQLLWAAILGLTPSLCYLTTASSGINFSDVIAFGVPIVEVNNAETGLWVTLGGFGVAIIAGIIISTTATLAEQLLTSATQVTNNPGEVSSQVE